MEALKLESIRLIELHSEVVASIKCKNIRNVAESFVSNIDRINSLIQLPPMLTCLASVIFTSIPGSRHHVGRERKKERNTRKKNRV